MKTYDEAMDSFSDDDPKVEELCDKHDELTKEILESEVTKQYLRYRVKRVLSKEDSLVEAIEMTLILGVSVGIEMEKQELPK